MNAQSKALNVIAILVIVLFFGAIGFLILFAFNWRPNPTSEFRNARQAWDEAQIDNYQIQYRFNSFENLGDIRVTVQDREVVHLEEVKGNFFGSEVESLDFQEIDKPPS